MYRQFPIVDLVAMVMGRINNHCTIHAYDVVGKNTQSPFCIIELVKVDQADTKNWYVKQYDFYIHIISETSKTSVPIYRYIQEVEEALSDDLLISEPYSLVAQIDGGVQTLYTEETGEKHAVLPYTFKIAYGLKVKE